MTNFKALGIGKEMDDLFSSKNKSELSILQESDYFDYPSINKRKDGQSYCSIFVVSCKGKDWWYKNMIGIEFFCKIIFRTTSWGLKYVSEYQGVRLTKTKEILFRSFNPEDVIIL